MPNDFFYKMCILWNDIKKDIPKFLYGLLPIYNHTRHAKGEKMKKPSQFIGSDFADSHTLLQLKIDGIIQKLDSLEHVEINYISDKIDEVIERMIKIQEVIEQ